MNVIVSNRQKDILDNANIDAIKDLNGLFSVDDLVNKFKNYFFSKMILDATSVVDFATREVLEKLSEEIGPDRLIILLPRTPEPPEEFKKLLIDLKIYNFSNKIEDIVRFIEKPNTYENIINANPDSYSGTNYYVDRSIKDSVLEDEASNNIVSNNVSNSGYNIPVNNSTLGDMMSSFNVYEEANVDNNVQDTPANDIVSETNNLNSTNIDNIDSFNNQVKVDIPSVQNVENEPSNITEVNTQNVLPVENNSTNKAYTFLNMDGFDSPLDYSKPKEKKLIGFKNITEHAGSTTLIYLLEKEAQKRNLDVISIEIDKDDFRLFRNSKMISVKKENLSTTLASLNESIVLVDLNDYQGDNVNNVVYLIEPSTIKLNKLMMVNKGIFSALKGKKVILNQSMLSDSDIPILEKEAGIEFFANISSINDRIDNSVITGLFDKLIKYQ